MVVVAKAKVAVLCLSVSSTFKILVLCLISCRFFSALYSMQAVASKTTKLGNWMIWMVHRAHLDDPTLVKFDTWSQLVNGSEMIGVKPMALL